MTKVFCPSRWRSCGKAVEDAGAILRREIEHKPAFDLPGIDEAVRLDGLFQAENALDVGRDPTGLQQAEEGRQIFPEVLRQPLPAARDVVEGPPS